MALNFPVDSWEPIVGVWGVDAQESLVIRQSANRTLNFLSTAVATRLDTKKFIVVEGDRFFLAGALFQADTTSGSSEIAMVIEWYDADKASLSTDDVFRGQAAVVSAFERQRIIVQAPALARYAKVRLEKNSFAFNLYWDEVQFTRARPHFEMSLTPSQTIPNSALTRVDFNTTETNVGFTLTTGLATVIFPGLYFVASRVVLSGLQANKDIRCQFHVNTINVKDGDRRDKNGSGAQSLFCGMMRELVAGDAIDFRVFHTSGGSIVIASGVDSVYFYAFRVG